MKDIRETGRNTQGVKLIDLEEGQKLQAIAPVISEDSADVAAETAPGSPIPGGAETGTPEP